VPQAFDGVPHPCGFQGAGFNYSPPTIHYSLLPPPIRKLLPQRKLFEFAGAGARIALRKKKPRPGIAMFIILPFMFIAC
jgi:hypothetical protein